MSERSVPRLALGLAVLAAERVRPGPAAGDGLNLAVGVAMESTRRGRRMAATVLTPMRDAARRVGRTAAALPGSGVVTRPLDTARYRFAVATEEARMRGAAAVGLGRAEAVAFLRTSMADGMGFAQREVVPPIVDGLVPHLVEQTLPRIIDGAMPQVRTRVLPVVVDDLTADPKLRDLVAEQGRGMLGDAAQELRDGTADADDRVEAAFRRLLRRPSQPPPAVRE